MNFGSQKIPWNSKVHCRFRNKFAVAIHSHLNPVHTITHYFFKAYFSGIFLYILVFRKRLISFSFFDQNVVHISHLLRSCT
jgi:hypothetical protein